MATTFLVQIDFDNDGAFDTAGDDISAYVIEVPSVEVGMATPRDRVAAGGRATIVVNNEDMRFSPAYASGAYYGKLLPGRPVRIQATDGVDTWTLFYGVVQNVMPDPGELGGKRATITCIDRIGQMQRTYVSLPVQSDKTADDLLKLIGSEAYKTGVATGYLAFADLPADGDTVTVDSKTYTFKTTLTPTAGEVLIGADIEETIDNLVGAVNGEGESGTQYAGGTLRCEHVTAKPDGELLDIPTAGVAQGFAVGRFTNGNEYWEGQSFVIETGGILSQIELWFGERGGTPSGTVTWSVYEYDEGTTAPTGAALETGTFTPTASEPAWNTITAAGTTYLTPDTYFLELKPTASQTTGNYWVILASDGNAGDVYSGGIFHQLQADPLAAWGTWTNQDMTMKVSLANVRAVFTANARGAWGNAIALAKSGANLTVSGAALTGGVDGPVSAISYEAGKRTFGLAADLWDRDSTTAMRAVMDVVESERGMFWAARDGTLTFKNTSWEFGLFDDKSAMALDNTHLGQGGGMRLGDVYNRVSVRYTPRALLDEGVVASSSSDVRVPPGKGTRTKARRNPTDALLGEATTVQLRFVDPATGFPMGAKDIVLPLEAGVDYKVYNAVDQDITSLNFVSVTTAITATGLDVTAVSIRNAPLVLRDLQARGTGIVTYDPMTLTLDDTDSQDTYGRQSVTIDMPLEATDAANFAESLAGYILGLWKDPAFRVERLVFGSDPVVSAVNLFSLELGNVITVTEDQTAVSTQKMVVLGATYSLRDSQPYVQFLVKRIDVQTYWILEDATYGVLGSTTRLAI